MIRVAVIARPHGLRGQVAVTLDDPRSRVLLTAGRVQVGEIAYSVRSASTGRPGQLVLALEGVGTLDEAAALRGREVLVEEALLPPLGPWEFWHRDLLSLTAVDATGQVLGPVGEIVDTAEVPVLIIQGEQGEIFVPLAEPYVREVDLASKKIVVAPPMVAG